MPVSLKTQQTYENLIKYDALLQTELQSKVFIIEVTELVVQADDEPESRGLQAGRQAGPGSAS